MLDYITTIIVRFFERWMPDALVVSVLLTLLTFILVLCFTDTTPRGAIDAWGDGFWSLLTFTNQITLTLLFGYALASTAPVHKTLLWASGCVHSARSAYLLVCLLTGLIALLSWSTALVAAGILSRAVGEDCRRREIRVHYPLLVAAAFSGFVVWHQGLSASIPLTLATPGHFLEAQVGVISTAETLFTWWNGLTAFAIVFTLPWMMTLLHPRRPEAIREIPDHLYRQAESHEATPEEHTPAARLEQSRWLALSVVGCGLLYLFTHYGTRGGGLTLNVMNLMLLIVGILCAGNLRRYLKAAAGGGEIVIPFLLQYPFYAGIAGMIATTGVGNLIVEQATAAASADSLPLLGFFSGGLLNVFIPSGGAQWAVQGPIMLTAAQQLGADLPLTAMAVAMGDQWTNLIQPLI
ncbi:MAG: TIGR00366 family protein, partial [Haliea sp.]